MAKEEMLPLTLQRDLSIPDWNEETGNAVDTVFPAGTEVTIPLVNGEIDADRWTDFGEPEQVLWAAAVVPCDDFYTDSTDFEMQHNPKWFGCHQFYDEFMNDPKFLMRCKGDMTQCPSRAVRKQARTKQKDREVIA